MKTEAIDVKSDFYWVDDQPLAIEIEWLKKNSVLDRWIPVDTRKNPDNLINVVLTLLKKPGLP
jgi:hypothetical protein